MNTVQLVTEFFFYGWQQKRVFLTGKTDGCAHGTGPARAADSMHIIIRFFR
jgi:hypothetical protein